jgi:phage shock protein E
MLSFFQKGNNNKSMALQKAINGGALVIDVRSIAEFAGGHINGAINIPVEDIELRAGDIKKMNKPVITCCRSGIRSNMAKTILVKYGIECYDGGAWQSLKKNLN